MKKILYIGGFSLLAGSIYYYFKKQLELALQYSYDIKTWKIKTLNTSEVEADITISLVNKSAFKIDVLEYDLDIFYKDILITRTFSTQNIAINPNSSVDVVATANIQFKEAKKALLPVFLNVLERKPINISVAGYVKVKFVGIDHVITFNKDTFEYSSDILQEYGWADDLEKLKAKLPFLNKK